MRDGYRQVVLAKGPRTQVAWIPAKLASVGNHVRIHDEDGWRVLSASQKMARAFIEDRAHDYRYQRRVSDV